MHDLLGTPRVGRLAPFDLALMLLIANAVQNAMAGPPGERLRHPGGISSSFSLDTAEGRADSEIRVRPMGGPVEDDRSARCP